MTIQPLSEMSNLREFEFMPIAVGVVDPVQFGSVGNGALRVINLMTKRRFAKRIHWSLGPELFTWEISEEFSAPKVDGEPTLVAATLIPTSARRLITSQ